MSKRTHFRKVPLANIIGALVFVALIAALIAWLLARQNRIVHVPEAGLSVRIQNPSWVFSFFTSPTIEKETAGSHILSTSANVYTYDTSTVHNIPFKISLSGNFVNSRARFLRFIGAKDVPPVFIRGALTINPIPGNVLWHLVEKRKGHDIEQLLIQTLTNSLDRHRHHVKDSGVYAAAVHKDLAALLEQKFDLSLKDVLIEEAIENPRESMDSEITSVMAQEQVDLDHVPLSVFFSYFLWTGLFTSIFLGWCYVRMMPMFLLATGPIMSPARKLGAKVDLPFGWGGKGVAGSASSIISEGISEAVTDGISDGVSDAISDIF